MEYIDSNLEVVLTYMDELSADSSPLWGTMNAQQMIEHLTHTIEIAMGKHTYPVLVKEEDYEKMRAYIMSDKPLPKNFKVDFATDSLPLLHEEIELAVDEYCVAWLDLEMFFAENPGLKTMHPNFGPLDFEHWKRLHEKHLTHHFMQFGLIKEA